MIMLNRKALARLSATIAVALGVVPALAQMVPPGPSDTNLGGVNTITGMVLVESGGRVRRNIAIRLQTMTRGDRVVTTDENGIFAFRQLPAGDYTLIVDKEKEFEPYAQVVSIVQTRSFGAQTYNVSIRLKSKAGTDAKPGVLNSEYAGVPKEALELFNKGANLAKKGDKLGAIEAFKQAIQAHPEFALAYNDIGVQYLQLAELDKADEALKSALAIRPDLYSAIVNRGIVLFQLKNYTDALPLWRRAVKEKDGEAVGHYFLGQTLANLGQFRDAEPELVRAISLGGEPMKEAYRLLAIIYNYSGDKERAAASLESYLKLAPKAPDADQIRATLKRLKS